VSKPATKSRAARPARPKPAPLPETIEAFPDVSTHEIKPEPNPFSSADWRMLAYAWAGFLVRVLIILGGIFTVYQYLDAREDNRVEKALELVNLWDQPQYQQAQAALATRLEELNTRYASLLGPNPTEAEERIYYRRLGQEAMTAEGGSQTLAEFRTSFDRIVYFLNRLSFCVDSGICSRDVADAFFKDFAISFWTYFGGYIEQVRARGDHDYADPIEGYVKEEAGE
jgi:hypothetical protein